jgi:hypothetical protein
MTACFKFAVAVSSWQSAVGSQQLADFEKCFLLNAES